MPDRSSFEYCVIWVVPLVERQEFLNVGVVVHCKSMNFLGARLDLELERLKAFAPNCDFKSVSEQLAVIDKLCNGTDEMPYFGGLTRSERFNWVAAKSSTIIQASPVHCGLTENVEETLAELFEQFVG